MWVLMSAKSRGNDASIVCYLGRCIILHKENPSGLQKPLMRHHYSTAGLQGTYGHQDMVLTESPQKPWFYASFCQQE